MPYADRVLDHGHQCLLDGRGIRGIHGVEQPVWEASKLLRQGVRLRQQDQPQVLGSPRAHSDATSALSGTSTFPPAGAASSTLLSAYQLASNSWRS